MEHLVDMPPPVRTAGPVGPHLPAAGRREIQRIGLLLFEGCSLLTAGIIAEAFRVANEIELLRCRRPVYQLSLLSWRGGNVACSSSIRVWTQSLDVLAERNFSAIFIACSERELVGERDARLMTAMLEVSTSVLELCRTGRDAMPARVSRARQHRATEAEDAAGTDWATPSVFWCRGGTDSAPEVMPSAADMALAQIESDLGYLMAREVARRIAPNRELATIQAEAVESDDLPELASSESTEKIRTSARWLAEHYAEAISVADAARVAAMSERNYLRRFKVTLGVTPSEYLLRTRLEMTCRLLLETDLPVDKIARRCGMGNGDRLAKLFRKRFSLSPTAYRNQAKTK